MPTQVLPITDIAKAGVIKDTPSVSLPPNVFNDVENVRFHNNAIERMTGEQAILVNVGDSEIIYSAFWPFPSLAPTDGYLVVVAKNENTDNVYVFQLSTLSTSATAPPVGATANNGIQYSVATGGNWQHTLFGGGRAFILNNGLTTPKYSLSPNSGFFNLPGWDSYLIDEQITSLIYDTASIPEGGGLDLGQFVNLGVTAPATLPAGVTTDDNQSINISVLPTNPNLDPFSITIDDYNDTNNGVPAVGASVDYDQDTGTTTVTLAAPVIDDMGNVTTQGVSSGDTVTIKVTTKPEIEVRAGVIRAYGNLLVAGNLTETERGKANTLRYMPGVVRTSDVAAAGSVPANWNPFHNGVNTADEFTLSSSSLIQDMAELQGVLYIYTNDSIHSMQATGNVTIPFQVRPVAKGWGALTTDAVLEFDGKHIVVGSTDVYVFAGHPGSITSIADGRVREYLYDNIHPTYKDNIFAMQYRRYDEIWISYPTNSSTDGKCDETLIWNYRDNTWTIRKMTSFWNGSVTPVQPNGSVDASTYYPMLTGGDNTVFVADADAPNYTWANGSTVVQARVGRDRLALTPEFDTENLASMALLAEGGSELDINVKGTSNPGDISGISGGTGFTFDTGPDGDYKTDIRVHGRFLNFRIANDSMSTSPWVLSGMQFEIGKGGQR